MSESICVCGKPIWGEGWNPQTTRRFYSHVDDGTTEKHEDGSWIEPMEQRQKFAPNVSNPKE